VLRFICATVWLLTVYR